MQFDLNLLVCRAYQMQTVKWRTEHVLSNGITSFSTPSSFTQCLLPEELHYFLWGAVERFWHFQTEDCSDT